MKVFLWTIFIVFIIEGAIKIFQLSSDEYPMVVTVGQGAVSAVIFFVFAIWAGFLLWY